MSAISRRWRWQPPGLGGSRSSRSMGHRSTIRAWCPRSGRPGSSRHRAEWQCLPEGDTIWRTANALRPRLVGKPLLKVRPEAFRKLEGATVTAVDTNGKHLLIHFESGLVLHSHMRMTGAWHLYRPGEAWRKPEGLAKIVLNTQDTVAVLFSAPVVELVREKEAVRDLAHLAPDLLATELDLDEVLRRARTSDRRTLGELLLDQRVAAGIGNIYRCESL